MSTLVQGKSSRRELLSRIPQRIIEFVFPPVCASCNRVGSIFCDDCKAEVEWLKPPICELCGKPRAYTVDRCSRCRNNPPPLEKIRAAAIYGGPAAKLLQRMKYEGYFGLSGELADLMVEAWPRWEHPVDLVVPIPLHPDRRRKRGYNQAELLVNSLSEQFGWPTDSKALTRRKNTKPQVGLSSQDRKANVSGAFRVREDIFTNQRVMLVDDVCTTGSTLASAAAELLAAGARSVTAYCLTTSSNYQDFHIA